VTDEDLTAGRLITLADGVYRLTAPNAGLMTGPGTNTYLAGDQQIAVIDPGPDDARHIDAICELAPGPIRRILVTHTHPDHSPGAMPLAERTGAELLGIPAPEGPHQDDTFRPDRVLSDGDEIAFDGLTLTAVHTPGHASNHICYLLSSPRMLFTGDHIMNGSTVVIDPPDGNMQDYLDSLERLKSLPIDVLAPGHGRLIDKPVEMVDRLVKHRLMRESWVVDALAKTPGMTLAEATRKVYREVDSSLHGLASRSLLAHLIKLEADGRAVSDEARWRLVE